MRKYLSFAELMVLTGEIGPDTEVVGWMARRMANTFYKVFVRAKNGKWICVETSFAHTMNGEPSTWQRDTKPSDRVTEVHGPPSMLGAFKPISGVGSWLDYVFGRAAALDKGSVWPPLDALFPAASPPT